MRAIEWLWLPLTFSTTPISTFYVVFHIFVVGEHRHFKFCVHVDHRTSQPTYDKLLLKGAWSRHVTNFNLLVP